ncbi:hypothetical protein [Agrococcus sp. SGAir0287]|uniref:hypothetical protein n=1 Tax=Agrococcus sp. SGAir0287 TaxID=2070347 RepID=UPI0010CD287D|nr:hypothetical protein [Agrococcus sp. SGAir0287]QCR19756.1 hypothetical protein C1N71_10225 [Agrococcus sp. SGAir0287]
MRTTPIVLAAATVAMLLAGCATPAPAPTPEPSAAPSPTACATSQIDVEVPDLLVTPAMLCDVDGAAWRVSLFQAIVEMPGDPDRDAVCDLEMAAFYDAIEPARAGSITLEVAEPATSSHGTIAVAAFDSGGAQAIASLDAFVAACAPPTGTWTPLSEQGWTGIEASLSSDPDFHDGRTYWIVVDDRFAVVQARPSSGRLATDLEDDVATVLGEQRRLLEDG